MRFRLYRSSKIERELEARFPSPEVNSLLPKEARQSLRTFFTSVFFFLLLAWFIHDHSPQTWGGFASWVIFPIAGYCLSTFRGAAEEALFFLPISNKSHVSQQWLNTLPSFFFFGGLLTFGVFGMTSGTLLHFLLSVLWAHSSLLFTIALLSYLPQDCRTEKHKM